MNTVWKFKLLAIKSGRVFEKEVIGFVKHEDAAACAKSLIPAINGPVIVLSYM